MELTNEQLERQDIVDNTILRVMNELAGTFDKGKYIEHDIAVIADVREALRIAIVDKLKLMSEQEFYPSIEE